MIGGYRGAHRRTRREDVALPSGYELARGDDDLVVRYRWWGRGSVKQALLTLVWTGMIGGAFAVCVVAEKIAGALFTGAMLLVGAPLMVHRLLGNLLNRTTVTVGRKGIAVRHGPVPFRGRALEAAEIRQLFADSHVIMTETSRGADGPVVKHELGYAVVALLGSGERVKVVDHLHEHAQALFLEQELEAALGLDDVPVEGELPLPGARRKKRSKRAGPRR